MHIDTRDLLQIIFDRLGRVGLNLASFFER